MFLSQIYRLTLVWLIQSVHVGNNQGTDSSCNLFLFVKVQTSSCVMPECYWVRVQPTSIYVRDLCVCRSVFVCMFVSAWHLAPLVYSPLVPSPAAPVSRSPSGPRWPCSFGVFDGRRPGLSAGRATASPPFPTQTSLAFLWRSSEAGGHVKAGFWNSKEKAEKKKRCP